MDKIAREILITSILVQMRDRQFHVIIRFFVIDELGVNKGYGTVMDTR